MESTNPSDAGSGAEDGGKPTRADVQARIERICDQVAARLPVLLYEIVRDIRTEIPDYGRVPESEHRQWVTRQARDLLTGIAQERAPQAEQIASARDLGRQRARQGLAIEFLLGAYQVTFQETWNALLAQTATDDPTLIEHLAYRVNLIWIWSRVLTGNASDAYSEETRQGQATRADMRNRLMQMLGAGPPVPDGATQLCSLLGLRAGEEFQALSLPAADWPAGNVDMLRRRLERHSHPVLCTTVGEHTVVLLQHRPAQEALSVVDAVTPGARVGVGLRRTGLDGAAESIRDAAAALARTGERRRTAHFADEWLAISLAQQADRLAPLLDGVTREALHSPHLAEAVRGFAEHGLSLTGAARALNLHPNSLSYRLDRWSQLTGCNPRSGEGLIRSLVAISFAEREESEPSGGRRGDDEPPG
ncbi:PucR family transcriptional regulator [Streptomyces adustus]|uniref:PucR family transcriptional regulator n=1 Tax=Streptomyces adustus TaxID=1609272 RepID=UPI00371F4B88